MLSDDFNQSLEKIVPKSKTNNLIPDIEIDHSYSLQDLTLIDKVNLKKMMFEIINENDDSIKKFVQVKFQTYKIKGKTKKLI